VRDLLRAIAGPVICAVVVTGLLAAWAGTGGASGASFRCPSAMSTAITPSSSVAAAMIFVESPPRDRPIAWLAASPFTLGAPAAC